MIKVKVKLFATLRKYHPYPEKNKSFEVELPEGATLNELYKEIGINRKEIKFTFVNNRSCSDDYVLQDGDDIGIFPPIAGG